MKKHEYLHNMLQFITVVILITYITIPVVDVLGENVTITSTISDKNLVCPGEQVNFTCVTGGSNIIAWTSMEYIDPGGARAEFPAVDVGTTQRFGQNTVATLVSADIVNGIRIMISQLMITVLPDFPHPSVTCLHVGLLINDTVFFTVPAIPGAVMETTAIELLGASEAGCIIFTQWESPNNIAESNIDSYIIRIGNNGLLNTSYITNENSKVIYLFRCMVQSVFIRALDRCNREGDLTSVPIQLRDNEVFTTADYIVTSVTSESPTDEKFQSGADTNTLAEASLSISVLLLVIIVLGIIIGFILCFKCVKVQNKDLQIVKILPGAGEKQRTTSIRRLQPDSGGEQLQEETEMHSPSSKSAEATAEIEDIDQPVSSQSDVAVNKIQEVENELTKVKNEVAMLKVQQDESQDQKEQLKKVEEEQQQMKEKLGELINTLMQLKDTQEQEAATSVTSTELKD